ncbi:hypothetical protein [Salibacterium aidingense]|uniref:hypothetical protein n=1 Tax=Salibacterium aidingense TaxID=384933 RepID=UPI000402345F|nr:hypothetical protein [Salibacterium aidingense]
MKREYVITEDILQTTSTTIYAEDASEAMRELEKSRKGMTKKSHKTEVINEDKQTKIRESENIWINSGGAIL